MIVSPACNFLVDNYLCANTSKIYQQLSKFHIFSTPQRTSCFFLIASFRHTTNYCSAGGRFVHRAHYNLKTVAISSDFHLKASLRQVFTVTTKTELAGNVVL